MNLSETQKVRAFEAEAFTRCSVAPITHEYMLHVLSKLGPADMTRILEEVNAVWSEIFSECIRFLGLSHKERLAMVLEDLAGRFGAEDSRVLLTPELSHEDLAELIGSSRPMATKLISELVEEGVILRQGRRYILAHHRDKVDVPVCAVGKGDHLSSTQRTRPDLSQA